MSYRQLIKPTDIHFLVRYRCDNKLQIRTKGFIKSEQIAVDETYEVQWGNKSQVDIAVILGAGSEKEMRARMVAEQSSVSDVSTKPTKTKTKSNSNKTSSGKPPAKMLQVASPPGFFPVTSVDVTTNTITVTTTTGTTCVSTTSILLEPLTATDTNDNTSTSTSSQHITTSVITSQPTPSTVISSQPTPSYLPLPDSPSTPSRAPEFAFRAVRPMTGTQQHTYLQSIDAAQSAMAKDIDKLKRQGESTTRKLTEIIENQQIIKEFLERLVVNTSVATPSVTQVTTEGEMTTEDVPPQYVIEDCVLRQLHKESSGAGNFASKLVLQLFPELFGVGNIRFQYNWYGGGKLQKTELCPVRKRVVKKYVVYYYPDVAAETVWRDRVVPKVNELLCRQSRYQRKERKRDAENVNVNDLPERAPLGNSDRAPFGDISIGSFVSYLNLD